MSLQQFARHNQSLVIAAIISLLSFGGILGCHLSEAQEKAIVTTAAETIITVAQGAPIPWAQIGLALGTILGSGAIVDNRRKDILIKSLQIQNADKTDTIITIASANSKHPG